MQRGKFVLVGLSFGTVLAANSATGQSVIPSTPFEPANLARCESAVQSLLTNRPTGGLNALAEEASSLEAQGCHGAMAKVGEVVLNEMPQTRESLQADVVHELRRQVSGGGLRDMSAVQRSGLNQEATFSAASANSFSQMGGLNDSAREIRCDARPAPVCVSEAEQSAVRVTRGRQSNDNVLRDLGDGFTVNIINLAEQPVEIRRSNLRFLNASGAVIDFATTEELAGAIREQAVRAEATANRRRQVGALASFLGGQLLSQASSVNQAQVGVATQFVGQIVSDSARDVEQARQRALAAAPRYSAVAFPFGAVPALGAIEGRLVINNGAAAVDRDPVVVEIQVGSEVHRVEFAGRR